MKRILLVDIDNTLLDFDKAEDYAISQVFVKYGVKLDNENKQKYSVINMSYWKKMERGEITKEELVLKRFDDFFGLFDIKVDAKEVNDYYFSYLCQGGFYYKNALEFLMKATSLGLKVVAITNGVTFIQESRMNKVGINKYFSKIYISDEIGFNKPDVRFFSKIEQDFPGQKDEMVLIGDSLSSDIQGGINFGVDTIWYNSKGLPHSSLPNHEVSDLMEVFDLIY